MDNRSEIEQKLGVTTGEKGKRKPMLAAFETKGVPVHPNFVADLREGRRSGERTNWRLESAQVTDSSKKNLFDSSVCLKALELRTFNIDRHRAHLFNANGFLAELANLFNVDLPTMEILVRAMRTDMAMTQAASPNDGLDKAFKRLAETYLKAKQDMPPSKLQRDAGPYIAVDENWNHQTMEDFYRKFYEHVPRRSIGTWVPYEMEALSLFYGQQIEVGNALTPFDRLSLEAHIKGTGDAMAVEQIRQATGIEVNYQVLEKQRNLLVYGTPVAHPR